MKVPEHIPWTKPAVVTSAGHVLTFGELDDRSLRLARLLAARGLAPGEAVGILLDNRAEYLVALWAAHRAGLLYTPISTQLTAGEVAHILADSGARLLLTTPSLAVDTEIDVLDVDDLPALLPQHPATPLGVPPGRDLMYSSGTTGRPKGIVTGIAGDLPNVLRSLYELRPDDVYLSPAPMYHTNPARTVSAMAQLGITTVLMERFDPVRFLELVEAHRVTVTSVVPTMLVRLMKLPAEERRSVDVGSLRVLMHNAAPCPVPIKHAVIEWLGPIVYESYGATEGHGGTMCDSREWLARPGTVGRAVLGEVHIVDDDGQEVPAGVTGTVWFSGAGTFEYRNEPAQTAASRDERGWATVGDIGHVDEDGYLFLTDRRTNLILVGGVNVYPQEAEDVLICHPDVLDAAVFGIPHEEYGEEVKAVVQLRPGLEPSPALAQRLVEHCRAELARVKCPRSVDFTEALPRDPSGKLRKRLLRAPYWDKS